MRHKAMHQIKRRLLGEGIDDAALARAIYEEWIQDRGKSVYTWDSAFHLLEVLERQKARWLDRIPCEAGE